jgi:hypothetical protein
MYGPRLEILQNCTTFGVETCIPALHSVRVHWHRSVVEIVQSTLLWASY